MDSTLDARALFARALKANLTPSLVENFALWIVFYSAAFIFYVAPKGRLQAFKLEPSYPKLRLVLLEFCRSARSVLILCAQDVFIRACFDVGLVSLGRVDKEDVWGLVQQRGVGGIFSELYTDYFRIGIFLFFWSDAHFYWVHRLLHESKWLYRNVHKVHHESTNPDPFSGLSFHPIEGFLYFTSVLLPLIAPIPRKYYDGLRIGLLLAPIQGHMGFGHECFPWGYHHYIHHAKFNYNFAAGVFPGDGVWDRLCGTAYHEGSKKTAERLSEAKSQADTVSQARLQKEK